MPPLPPLLMLDFDGVLNTVDLRGKHPWPPDFLGASVGEQCAQLRLWLDPVLVGRINRAAMAAGAHVVISSSWRALGLNYLRPILADFGLQAPVVDKIGNERRGRGRAITDWVAYHSAADRPWVAVDDDVSLGRTLPPGHFVLTDDNVGFTEADMERVLQCLSPS